MAAKSAKDTSNRDIINVNDIEDGAKGFIDRILGDISKTTATKQILIGACSGWATGYISMKVGKVAAISVGGGIILLQIANDKGYIKINWDKVNTKLDKVSDKVEQKLTGEGPNWMDKMERFVDRKLDKAENILVNNQKKAKKWYSSFIGDEDKQQLKDIHIFLISFVAGVAVGIATS